MRCPIESQETADLLLAYTARRLDAASAAIFEQHIDGCPACREFADAQQAVWSALDAWEAAPVSPDFDRRLYRRIEERGSWWNILLQPFRPAFVRQGLPIAAAACLLVMVGILIDRPAGETVVIPAVQTEVVQADQVDTALEDMEMLREFHRTVRADATRTSM
jgi:anti-sigma factor RsiW